MCLSFGASNSTAQLTQEKYNEILAEEAKASQYADKNDYENASICLKNELDLAVKYLGANNPQLLRFYENLGQMYQCQSKYDLALKQFESGLGIARNNLGDSNEITALFLKHCGEMHEYKYELQEALNCYDKELKIMRLKFGDNGENTGIAMCQIGELYGRINDPKKGIYFCEGGIKILLASKQPNIDALSMAYHGLGGAYYDEDEYQKSLDCIIKAVDIDKQKYGTNDVRLAPGLAHLANAYSNLDQYDKANEIRKNAITLYENLGVDRYESGLIKIYAACDYIKNRNYDDALNLAMQAMPSQVKTFGENGYNTLKIKELISQVFFLRNDRSNAVKYLRDYLSGVDSMTFPWLNLSESQRLALTSYHLKYDLPIQLLDPKEVSDLAIKWKGLVIDSLLEDKMLAIGTHSQSDSNLKSSKIKELKNSIAKIIIESKGDSQQQIIPLEKQIESLEISLYGENNKLLNAKKLLQINTDKILLNLEKDQCVLNFIIYKDITSAKNNYAISILCNNNARIITLGTESEINRNISDLRKALDSNSMENLVKSNDVLYKVVWAPILAELPSEVKRVYICPDGDLNFVSFAALFDVDKNFVSQKYQTTYVGVVRDLLRICQYNKNKNVRIYANPLFKTSDLIADANKMTNKKSSDSSMFMEEFAKVQLAPLPGTEIEANLLTQIAIGSKWNPQTYLGAKASKKDLMAEKGPAVLHLATHGFFLGCDVKGGDGDRGMKVIGVKESPSLIESKYHKFQLKGINPMRQSGIALTGAQSTLQAWGRGEFPDPSNDGILTAEEVAGLDLDGTWLVTLSACETGVGQVQSGEGVLGLRRAFMMAGAQNLMMTLWPVSDEVTPKIMGEFYKEALATHDAAGSLAKVQRDWLVKLRKEKGLLPAIRDAGPFAMVVMANPNQIFATDLPSAATPPTENKSLPASHNAPSLGSTPIKPIAEPSMPAPVSTPIQPIPDTTPQPESTPIQPTITKPSDSPSASREITEEFQQAA